ncbi:unnamed protein product [Moneuplotes crassus]|uniref:Uncharacterized protein n=1 Tax=Euplotes crassus TaxID=5936 RepID=A0AAD1XAG5_EUPCR|nr:unnamed protein product [Moneuplotes crassus]
MIKPVKVLFNQTKDHCLGKIANQDTTHTKIFGVTKVCRPKRNLDIIPCQREQHSTHQKVFQITRNCPKFESKPQFSLNSICKVLNEETLKNEQKMSPSSSKIFAVEKFSKLERKVKSFSAKNSAKTLSESSHSFYRRTRSDTIDEISEELKIQTASQDLAKVFKITKSTERRCLSKIEKNESAPRASPYRRYFTIQKVVRRKPAVHVCIGGPSSAFANFVAPSRQSKDCRDFYSFLSSLLPSPLPDISCASSFSSLSLNSLHQLSLSLKLAEESFPQSNSHTSTIIQRPLPKKNN